MAYGKLGGLRILNDVPEMNVMSSIGRKSLMHIKDSGLSIFPKSLNILNNYGS